MYAWHEFRRGKRNKFDVQLFESNLEDNLFAIHEEFRNKTYRPSPYVEFYITDPKLRHIHKASVRDRVVHQAVFRVLYPLFDSTFIYDSYSCRCDKGTHRAVSRLEEFYRKESLNKIRSIFVLKCDVSKFFESVDHEILLRILRKKINDGHCLWLLELIIHSFQKRVDKGIPLGNVTSQLFANIYLNELDQFMKRTLKVRYYIRYSDDFIVVRYDKDELIHMIPTIRDFLEQHLQLNLHPRKVIIRKFSQGIDFLGYVALPHHRVLRIKTRQRMFRKMLLNDGKRLERAQSYLGLLKHCNGYALAERICSICRFAK